MQKNVHINKKGFTIVEMMVSISLFVVVLTISIGGLLSILDSYRKAQLLSDASSSLKLILEDMTRNIAQGGDYHCDGRQAPVTPVDTTDLSLPRSCPNPYYDSAMIFKSNKGGEQISYWLDNGEVYKRVGVPAGEKLTTLDVIRINDLKFYVSAGENVGDDEEQPRVTIVVSGEVGEGDLRTEFNVQSTITQRNPK
jgi:prepilin-type N-terminal cleavage/methylation domain-containing protein